jgi:hypothetical protein
MSATANSPYQAKRLQHLVGIPPNCDPQRSTETFSAYAQRVFANGVWPDIGATEADVDYLARIASYGAVLSPPVSASYAATSGAAITATSATSATTAISASFATSASWAPTNA